MTPRFHTLTIAEIRRETPDAVSIAFAVPEGLHGDFHFQHGQYLTLKTHIDGTEVRRSYSICSGLDDGELRVAVKKVDGGAFSTFANHLLKPGDAIDVMTPMGRFTVPLDAAAARLYVAIASGSGITPILSIIKSVLAREPQSRFVLFYGNRNAQSILFKDALEDLKDRFLGRLSVHHILSREAHEIALFNGRIDAEKVAQLMRTVGPVEAVDHVFLCGPDGMTEAARAALQGLGIGAERVHVERFVSDAQPAGRRARAETETPRDVTLTVQVDGARHTIPLSGDQTIIDAALAAGLDLPYSCRGGMCCTCRAKVTEGKVEMDQNYSLEPWELQAGYVLTCQARPTTDTVTVDYDAM